MRDKQKSVLGSLVGLAVLFLGVSAYGLSARLTGIPLSMQAAPGNAVGSVNVLVKKGWLNSDVFSLHVAVIETLDIRRASAKQSRRTSLSTATSASTPTSSGIASTGTTPRAARAARVWTGASPWSPLPSC